jgi:hypothetical protein
MVFRRRLVLHDVGMSHDNRPTSEDGTFDVAAYSRMKYGHAPSARTYGYALAGLFRTAAADVLADPHAPMTICGPATSHTPKPARAIAYYFMQSLNTTRVSCGLSPAMLVDIHHIRQGEPVPYASLNRHARRTAMTFTEDYVDPRAVQGRHVICIDDAIVTGTVEAKMAELIEPLTPATTHYLYAIRINAGLADSNPAVEDQINLADRPTLSTIADFIDKREFQLNDRVMNLLLAYPDRSEIYTFLDKQHDTFLERIITETLAGGGTYARRGPHLLSCLHEIMGRRRHPLLDGEGSPGSRPIGYGDTLVDSNTSICHSGPPTAV